MTTSPRQNPHQNGIGTKLYADYQPAPLPLARLLQILRSLPESDQLSFAKAIDKALAAPLSPERLAQIWISLPENERYGFSLALDERICDQLLVLTMPERGST